MQEGRGEVTPSVHLPVFISIMFYPILYCYYRLIWLSLSVFQSPVPLNTVFTCKFDGIPSLKCLSHIPAATVKPVSILIWNR